MHLSLASPWGGPRAEVGEYRDFMGTLQQNFCPCGGGIVGTFLMPYSQGECGDFASVQLRGDWERSIVCSIDGKMAEENVFCRTICICH